MRRVLLAFGALMAVFIIIGLAMAGRDPILRTYGQAGRELENAMNRLGKLAIACSRDIVASAAAGGHVGRLHYLSGGSRGPGRLRGFGHAG